MEGYLEVLAREAELRKRTQTAGSVYLGGGSPSVLNLRQLERLAEALRACCAWAGDAEFTIEVNPEDITAELLRGYRALGINRLSIGAQSFRDEDLRFLQRPHDAAGSRAAVEMALEMGFSNISIDFIIGLPGQELRHLEESFAVLAQLPAPHVSAYILEGVEGVGNDQERDSRLYFYTVGRLGELGYRHYEVSNFCKPGLEARHNLKYWRNEEYVGLGVSASGFTGGVDYRNVGDLKRYREKVEAGCLPVEEENRHDVALRGIITGLRLLEGVPEGCFAGYSGVLDFLIKNRMLVRRGGRIAVARGKILLLNEILGYFV